LGGLLTPALDQRVDQVIAERAAPSVGAVCAAVSYDPVTVAV